ncbi:MAG: hypothetical protein ABI898_08195 [Sphingomonadales bacterium]
MKILTFTAALMIGTAAIAQTAPEPPAAPPADAMQTPPAPPAEPALPPPAPDTMTPPAAPMAAPAPVSPAPAEATSPAADPGTAPVAQASYPRCSASVTDQCRQGSARESDRKGGPRKRR